MLRIEIIKDYMDHYKVNSKNISIEDVAKILVKCKILDKRNQKYNIIGYTYEELIYNELIDIKENLCFTFFTLLEYSLYFEQNDEKLYMIESIYQALSFLVNMINKTGTDRKNCRYKNVIKIVAKYEKDFYDNNLKEYNEKQKETLIKKDLIENTGEFLFNLEYYRLVENSDKVKSEEYWKAIISLVNTIDKIGNQKNIKVNKDMEESIKRKTLTYLSENKKEFKDVFEYNIK